jgi:hypothetical protein
MGGVLGVLVIGVCAVPLYGALLEASACSAVLGIGPIPEAGDIPIDANGRSCAQLRQVPIATLCPYPGFVCELSCPESDPAKSHCECAGLDSGLGDEAGDVFESEAFDSCGSACASEASAGSGDEGTTGSTSEESGTGSTESESGTGAPSEGGGGAGSTGSE